MFEPAGEECGTVYDESVACPVCGGGRRQMSDLILDLRKTPRRADIARTIADEWIVSQRLAALLQEAAVTGIDLRPVRHKGFHDDDAVDLRKYPSGRELIKQASAAGLGYPSAKFDSWLDKPGQEGLLARTWHEHARAKEARLAARSKPPPAWFQLVVTSAPAQLSEKTRFGIDPFDEDGRGEYRCPRGHVKGLNILSEVSLERDSWDGSDIVVTDGLVGTKRGLLRPRPLLLVTQRVRRILEENRMRGYKIEVAHLV